LSRALSDTRSRLGLNATTAWIAIITVLGWAALRLIFKWNWTQVSEEIITAAAFVLAMIMIGILILIGELTVAPVRIDEELRRAIRAPAVSVRQRPGLGDNIQSRYSTADSVIVIIRDLIIVNQDDRDDVVSLKLWVPVNNSEVTFSPQAGPPPAPPPGINIEPVPTLLKGVENIPARRAATGSVWFKVPKNTVLRMPELFTLSITSELSGITRAFNSLDLTEVSMPYPRTIEELNEYNVRRGGPVPL